MSQGEWDTEGLNAMGAEPMSAEAIYVQRLEAERDELRRELEAAVPVKALVERNARLEAECDRLRFVIGHLCVYPDESGRSCGECVPCRMVAAAFREVDAKN